MNYTFFIQRGRLYFSKPTFRGALIASLIGLGALIYLIYTYGLLIFTKEIYGYVLAAFVVFAFFFYGYRTKIDKTNNTIGTSYWGLFSKTVPLNSLRGFKTLRRQAYGMVHDGTDIIISYEQNGKSGELVLYKKIGNTKKIQLIIEEIEYIIKNG